MCPTPHEIHSIPAIILNNTSLAHCSGSNDCLGYHVRIGCSIVVTLYGETTNIEKEVAAKASITLHFDPSSTAKYPGEKHGETPISRKKRVRKYFV